MGQCASKRGVHVYQELGEQRNQPQQLPTKLKEDSSKRSLQIMEAIESDDPETLRQVLLLLKPNVDDVLHSAYHSGKLKAVQFLVDREKADVDHQDPKGWTILHYSVYEGKIDFVRWILCHTCASVDIRDLDGDTPLHKLKSVNFNAKEGEEKNPADMFEILQLLIEEGDADVSATNHDGHTFLDLIEQTTHGKTHADHFPSWMKVRSSGVDSYTGFAESDYDLDSTADSSVACSALSLSHYHIDAESDINDDGHFYGLGESDTENSHDADENFAKVYGELEENSSSDAEEPLTEERRGSSATDWIAYLSAASMEVTSDSEGFSECDLSDKKKIPLTPETSMEEEDLTESPVHLTPTYDEQQTKILLTPETKVIMEEEDLDESPPKSTPAYDTEETKLASTEKTPYLPERIVEYSGVWPRDKLFWASDSLVEYGTHEFSETESTCSLREMETRTSVSI